MKITEPTIIQKHQSDKLIFLGVLLFFFGLIIGLLVPVFANPRIGLSSHIEGVLNGMFLIVLGLIWHKVDLSDKWLKITFWLALYGTFANWFGMLFAAVFNAGKMLGVAANGKEGPALAEDIVTFLLISLSIAMLIICISVLIGLHRYSKAKV
jgi:(hydroxyamino)benzene mutase